MSLRKGDPVHAFSGGVLWEGTYLGKIRWDAQPDPDKEYALIELNDGQMFICEHHKVRFSRELPALVPSRA